MTLDVQTITILVGLLLNIIALVKIATTVERRFTKLELTQNSVLKPALESTQVDVKEIKTSIESIKTRLLLTRKSDFEKLPDIGQLRNKGY